MLKASSQDVDLIVHVVGPFQQTEKCTVLEAAIKTKTAYLDVFDDTSYELRTKSSMSKALEANIPAITTGRIYPGVSNVMAAELVRVARSESKCESERLRFSYYTAGTCGADPTIFISHKFFTSWRGVINYPKLPPKIIEAQTDLYLPVVRILNSPHEENLKDTVRGISLKLQEK